eukprot:2521402-Rhodomonas_salina.3
MFVPGNPVWSFAWPHRCENPVTRSPTGTRAPKSEKQLRRKQQEFADGTIRVSKSKTKSIRDSASRVLRA